MRLSRDKVNKVAHVVSDALAEMNEVDFVEDRNTIRLEVRKILDTTDAKARLADAGFDGFASTPEELGTFVNEQLVLWTRLIKEAGIEPQ